MAEKKALPFNKTDLSPFQLFVVEQLIDIRSHLGRLDARTGIIAVLCGLVGGALVVWGKI